MSLDIPYTSDVRPDTGFTNGNLGMWLFLASEVMFFGSLFSSYALLRYGAPSWPDQSAILSVPLASANTAILVFSSVMIALAARAARTGTFSRYRLYMAITIAAGVVFLGVKSYEYADKLSHGLTPAANNFLGLYFAMTGVHALHLVGGVVANAYLVGPGAALWHTRRPQFAGRVAVAALYWHFVDAVWLVLFPVLYLL